MIDLPSPPPPIASRPAWPLMVVAVVALIVLGLVVYRIVTDEPVSYRAPSSSWTKPWDPSVDAECSRQQKIYEAAVALKQAEAWVKRRETLTFPAFVCR